jgi:hypothetical protein
MNWATKVFSVLFCLLLCGGGAVLMSMNRAKSPPPENPRPTPVINPQPDRAIWLWA